MTKNRSFQPLADRVRSIARRVPVLFAVMVVLVVLWWAPGPPRILSRTLYALQAGAYTLSDTVYASFQEGMALFSSKRALEQENARLREELERFYFERQLLAYLREENQRLREQAEEADGEATRVRAKILRRPPETPYDLVTVLLPAGKAEEVAVGDVALYGEEVAVGEVVAREGTVAFISLFSSPGTERYAWVLSDGRMTAVRVEGLGGGALRALIPRDAPVREEDLLLLSDTELWVLGTVEQLRAKPEDALRTVLFSTPFALRSGLYLSIVTSRP